MNTPHVSVLLNETIELFSEKKLKWVLDATLGAGGHALALLEAHPEIEQFVGIDQDDMALKIAKERLKKFEHKCRFIKGNFGDIKKILAKESFSSFDAILADIGVSSMQLDTPERGFSFMKEGPLDMRMDTTQSLTAEVIVNTWEEKDLVDIFFKYGEEKDSRRIVKAIIMDREKKPFKTTKDLASLLERIAKNRVKGHHPATRVFQALRIAVNEELLVLTKFIGEAIHNLAKEGILAIITFHSLEDRIVKQAFQYLASDKESTSGIGGVFLSKEPTVKLLTRKPISPNEQEIEENPRSRSAHLRAVVKL